MNILILDTHLGSSGYLKNLFRENYDINAEELIFWRQEEEVMISHSLRDHDAIIVPIHCAQHHDYIKGYINGTPIIYVGPAERRGEIPDGSGFINIDVLADNSLGFERFKEFVETLKNWRRGQVEY